MEVTYFFGGLLCDPSLFKPQLKDLSNFSSCYVVDITQATDMFDFAKSFLVTAPKKFNLVGFSLGSWFTQIIAYLAPERVKRFCIISSADCELLPKTASSMHLAINEIQQGKFFTYIENSLNFYLAPSNQNNQTLKNQMLTIMKKVGPEIAIRQLNCMLGLQQKPFKDLSFLSCPTYIIHGREDSRISLEANERMQKQIQNAKLFFVENAGHFIPMEQPEQLNQILISWLKEKI